MAIVFWYKGDKRIRIDDSNKVATDSYTKKGYGPKEKRMNVGPKAETLKKDK